MKIIYKKGNALNGPEPIVAHGCNNRGVMGSGIAKEIHQRFSIAYDLYRYYYLTSHLRLGDVHISFGTKSIANCITQDGYGRDGAQYVDYDAIRECMRYLNKHCSGVHIAMPKIGAGLGGGDWNIIEKIIEEESTAFQPVVYEL